MIGYDSNSSIPSRASSVEGSRNGSPIMSARPTDGQKDHQSATRGPGVPEEFRNAVRAYEWEAALTLAATDQEKTDVAESKNRVDWFEYFLAQGDSTQAMLYAITREERQRAEAVSDAATAAPQSDETETAISQLTNVFSELPSPSRRTSMTSRISSAIGSPFRRKSSKDGEASPKANGGEVHLQAGRV